MKLILASFNPIVGDLRGNTEKILVQVSAADKQGADAIVFPELALTGYPPEDLLLREDFLSSVEQALNEIACQVENITVILGTPRREKNALFNSAAVIENQRIQFVDKTHLPNEGVFDERRYFEPARQTQPLVEIAGIACGVLICEDIWQPDVAANLKHNGAQCLISINASPYHHDKHSLRIDTLKQRYQETKLAIAYVNTLGGQDELIFDGGAVVYDEEGGRLYGQYFESSLTLLCFNQTSFQGDSTPFESNRLQRLEQALVLGIRDYVHKNGFTSIVLGLSGGIDSAVTLALAVKALGAEYCKAVMMPSNFTADISQTDAAKQAKTLKVVYQSIAIEAIVDQYQVSLKDVFDQPFLEELTAQNLQARARGVLLMALSNNTGSLLLTTGNKSEMSVGYATLYGDMSGAYAPLKDVFKQDVYALAKHLNRDGEVIPERVITRPPSAELAPNQQDTDTLPDYAVLDEILRLFIEEDCSVDKIVQQGFDEKTVKQVVWLVKINEHKRYQSAPGARVTKRSLGRDRRYPLTSKFPF